MTESSYTAWDDNLYEWPPPDGWYEASDGKWWPEGYGPGSAGAAENVAPDIIDTAETELDDIASAVSQEPVPTTIFPAGDLVGHGTTDEPAQAEHQRPVYDELPPIDDVFGGEDPFAEPDDDETGSGSTAATKAAVDGVEDDQDDGLDVHFPPLDEGVGSVTDEAVAEAPTPTEAPPGSDGIPAEPQAVGQESVGGPVDVQDSSPDEAARAGVTDPDGPSSAEHDTDSGLFNGARDAGGPSSDETVIEAVAREGVSEDLRSAGTESDLSDDVAAADHDRDVIDLDSDVSPGVGESLDAQYDDEHDTIDPADGLAAAALDPDGVAGSAPAVDAHTGADLESDTEAGDHLPGQDALQRFDQGRIDADREGISASAPGSPFIGEPIAPGGPAQGGFDAGAAGGTRPVEALAGDGTLATYADLDHDPSKPDGAGYPGAEPLPYDDEAVGGARRGLDTTEPPRTLWPLFIVVICAALLALLAVAYFLFRDTGDVSAEESPSESIPAVGLGSIGQPYDFGTGVVVFYDAGGQQRRWVVQVLSPVADGTDEFASLAAGVAPVDGDVLAFSRVRVTYQSGPTPGHLDDLRLNAVGSSTARYSYENDRCAAASDALVLDAELEPSESVEGNLCWEIAEADLTGLKLAIEAGPADGTVHLSLN